MNFPYRQSKSGASLFYRGTRITLWRRIRKWTMLLVYNGKIQFFLLFSLFLTLATIIIHLLEGKDLGSKFSSVYESFWFTIVTITTVGYGDMSPTGHVAQGFAMLEMLVGIGLVGVITGNVASFMVERNRKRALGLAPLPHLSNHTMILGWKRNMKNILLGVLHANPGLNSADLVLVTTENPSSIADLRRDRRLRNLQFIYGLATDRITLLQGRVKSAERVIILAESQGTRSRDEVDSRTVMAATTVENENSKVYTCTEIMQHHFIPYLRQARVEEVIPEDENARALLCGASLGEGLGNVVSALLPHHVPRNRRGKQPFPHQGILQVAVIPPEFVGASYSELAAYYYEKVNRLLLVGLLENTGSIHDRKLEVFQKALKHPEYSAVMANLKVVGNIYSNQARINPSPLSTLLPHSLALVLTATHSGAGPGGLDLHGQQPEATSTSGNQLLICGWRPSMAELAHSILSLQAQPEHEGLTGLTILSQMPSREREALEEHPGLGQVRIMEGEPTNPKNLLAAGIEECSRVMVLSPPATADSQGDVDARNVMAGIAISNINPLTYKCVEITDARIAGHTLMKKVEEMVNVEHYQQVMVSQASSGSGLSNAMQTLLDPSQGRLQVVDMPKLSAESSFADYRTHFSRQDTILAGILEHSGNIHLRQRDYLLQVRTQPRVGEAIEHLRNLKTVINNQPIINPAGEYRPGPHGRAIIITPEQNTP